MTRLLVSVRDPVEADLAASAGAHLVDGKDPDRGALGALAVETARAVVAAIAGRAETSVVAGEFDGLDGLAGAVRGLAGTGASFVKIGLGGALATPGGAAPLRPLLAGVGRFVAVLAADDRVDPGMPAALAEAGFTGAMIDTRAKDGRRLGDFRTLDELAAFVAACRRAGLMSGLAGSLRLDDIPVLAPLAPDYLGFRGGVCAGSDRRAALDPARIRRAAALLAAPAREAAE